MDEKKLDLMRRMAAHAKLMSLMQDRMSEAVKALENTSEYKLCEKIQKEIEDFHNSEESKTLHAEALEEAQRIIDSNETVAPIKDMFEAVTGLHPKKEEKIGVA